VAEALKSAIGSANRYEPVPPSIRVNICSVIPNLVIMVIAGEKGLFTQGERLFSGVLTIGFFRDYDTERF
jgi:hypothetical protein